MDATTINIVKNWFDKSSDWQKDTFINLWKGKDLDETKKRALKLVFKEYEYAESSYAFVTKFPEDLDDIITNNSQVILKSISNVQGVAALRPTRPLEFTEGLNVVYGANGCGKSSYVKILKKAENPKDDISIIGNVFEKSIVTAKATLTFSEDGTEKTVDWSLQNQKNLPIRIYDSKIAQRFIEKSTETVYEPKLLHIFTLMADVSEYIGQEVNFELNKITSNTERIPNEIINSDLCKTYNEIDSLISLEEFDASVIFTENDKKQLDIINKAFEDSNPEKTKDKLLAQIGILNQIKQDVFNVYSELDKSKVTDYLSSRETQIKTKKAFDEFLLSVREVSIIDNFGSELWKQMWESSQKYSNSIKDSSVNNICVLCQQSLSHDAKIRFEKFSEIYSSDLDKKKNDAYEQFQKKTQKLSGIITEKLNTNQIKQILTTNAFSDENISPITNIINKLYDRAIWLYNYDSNNNCPDIVPLDEATKIFSTIRKQFDLELEALKEFLNNYDEQYKRKLELQSLKWFNEHRNIISTKKSCLILDEIKSGIKTNSITKTKNTLSDKLITEVYISRFTNELSALNPSHSIKVELLSDGKKGKTSHRVSIKGAVEKRKTEEILSEGEYRVVSIAAFMADLNSINKTQAFIFDDPINSLDHNYEDNVAKQLVKLSFERQVIIFTHRIAFAETLKTCLEMYMRDNPNLKSNSKFNYIELRNNPMGEPIIKGDYNKTDAISSLKLMKSEALQQIRKLRTNGDYELADARLKSCCTVIRSDIEFAIEKILLDGIVTRYNKNISTMKIKSLNKIKPEDITFIDKMMTKYSYYEHSQPSEKPIELPELDEIEKDIDELIAWGEEYRNRLKKKG